VLCVGLSELSKGRQHLVQHGNDIKQGSWSAAGSGKSAVTALHSDDGAVYYASVKASQQELDAACGAEGAITPSSTVAASAVEAESMQCRYDFSKLREVTATAKAAVGVPAGVCSSTASAASNSHSNCGTPDQVEPEPLLSSTAHGLVPCQLNGAAAGGVVHHVLSHPVEVDEAQLAAEPSETPLAASGDTAEALESMVSPEDVVLMTKLTAQPVNAGAVKLAQAAELYDLD